MHSVRPQGRDCPGRLPLTLLFLKLPRSTCAPSSNERVRGSTRSPDVTNERGKRPPIAVMARQDNEAVLQSRLKQRSVSITTEVGALLSVFYASRHPGVFDTTAK